MLRKLMIVVLVVVIASTFFAVAGAQDAPAETPVQFIQLEGPAAERNAEISSLVWYGDTLLFITENPFIYAQEGEAGRFFALDKSDILDYLAAEDPAPLNPRPVPLIGPDILNTVGGYSVAFDGFEAAAIAMNQGYFVEDRIFLAIEADTVSDEDPTMRAYVVSGAIQPGLRSIRLDLNRFVEIPRQSDFNNMSYESLFLVDNMLYAVYEANGAGVNESPVAYGIDLMTGERSEVAFPNVEYRITDTTAVDENGVFWATNYFFVGEDFLAAESDPIFETYGIGASQEAFDGYERLVAMQFTNAGVALLDQAPIQLEMTEDSNGRNWEGIARLDDMGFLVITDRYPVTLFAFVPAE